MSETTRREFVQVSTAALLLTVLACSAVAGVGLGLAGLV
jgi:hypothetical protein